MRKNDGTLDRTGHRCSPSLAARQGPRHTLWAAVAALLIGGWGPSQALAQDPADHEARALFEAGQVAYTQGEYRRALDYFQRSHELSDRPGLLYNIATAQDRLRMDREALENYRSYVEQDPDGSHAQIARNRIRDLEAIISRRTDSAEPREVPASPRATGTEDEAADAPPSAMATETATGGTPQSAQPAGTATATDEDGAPGIVPVITLAAGGVLVAASAGTLVWWLGLDSEIAECNEVGCRDGESIVSERDTAAGLTIALGGLGIAAITTGLVLWLTGDSETEEPISFSCSPTLGGVGCAGQF